MSGALAAFVHPEILWLPQKSTASILVPKASRSLGCHWAPESSVVKRRDRKRGQPARGILMLSSWGHLGIMGQLCHLSSLPPKTPAALGRSSSQKATSFFSSWMAAYLG